MPTIAAVLATLNTAADVKASVSATRASENLPDLPAPV